MIFYTVVTGSYPSSGDSNVNGTITFDLGESLDDPVDGLTVGPLQEQATIAADGIAIALACNDSPDLTDPTTQYYVTQDIVGSPNEDFYVTVPHSPVGSRTVVDAEVAVGQNVVESATAHFTDADVGAYVFSPAFALYSTIESIIDSSHAQLSTASTETASAVTLVVGASVNLASLRQS